MSFDDSVGITSTKGRKRAGARFPGLLRAAALVAAAAGGVGRLDWRAMRVGETIPQP